MKFGFAVALGAWVLPALALAEDFIPPVTGGRTWMQQQVEAAKQRHPHIEAIIASGAHDKTHEIVILGSTLGASVVFTRAPPAARDGLAMSANRRRFIVREALLSNSRHRIGTLELHFAYRLGLRTASLLMEARAVQAEIGRATLSSKNAIDPYPYDPAYDPDTYAQVLTEQLAQKHPDVLVMMLHATRPGGKDNVVIGSNIGRFGKLADEDDLRVIEQGSTNLEVGGDDKDRFETELPLLDAAGTRIGALGLVFGLAKGQDQDALHRHGIAIRDELASLIPNNAALFARHR